MTPSEWDRVMELFHAAVETPPDARTMLLDQACGTGTGIRNAVEELLREYDSADGFLSRPILDFSQAAQLFAPEKRFERFILKQMLGRGGMGEVWSAHDLELDRPVALKFLRAHTAALNEAARIVREAQAASALNHPNIVTIHGVVQCEGIAAIVMELVEGSSLSPLRNAPVDLGKVLVIAPQIARALAAAHQHGIVHGDIKPENIMQRGDGYIKVLDFGLAHRVIAEGMSRTERPGFGTMRYMSPEQARGEPLTPASDVFSLGLVLFELTAGKHPFADQSPAAAMNSILNRTPPEPSSVNPRIPAALNSLILTMLAKQPARRPSATETADRLDALARAHVHAGRRLWLIGALATSLAAAAVAGWLLSRPHNPPQFANLRIEPLTSQDGWEAAPSFSPDGKTVAFTWAPNLETAPQIYLKRDSDSAPVRLTDARVQGIIGYPVWSPDGKWIAFKRVFDSAAGIFAMPAAGGEQKKLADLRVRGLSNVIDWSPDGDHLAFADLVSNSDRRLAIFTLNLRTGEKRRLTTPASVEFADWNPGFSPDGRVVAFKRVGGFWDDAMYVAPVSGGEARRVTWQGGGIVGHAWSPDGKSLIVSCQRGGTVFGLWRFPLDGSPPERIIQGGSDAIAPALAWKTGRLAWVNQNEDINIYRVTAAGEEPPRSLIASTARDRAAAWSPDGTIAFVSDRSGAREIWLARDDGSDQRRVTSFNGPDVDNLVWSPDGRRLAFYARVKGHSDIFTLDCDAANRRCGQPKATISGIKAQAPGWSRDGKFLYFASDRTGRFEVWRERASGGQPVQITHRAGFMARESPDGKWLYFSKDADGTLWRMRLPTRSAWRRQ